MLGRPAAENNSDTLLEGPELLQVCILQYNLSSYSPAPLHTFSMPLLRFSRTKVCRSCLIMLSSVLVTSASPSVSLT